MANLARIENPSPSHLHASHFRVVFANPHPKITAAAAECFAHFSHASQITAPAANRIHRESAPAFPANLFRILAPRIRPVVRLSLRVEVFESFAPARPPPRNPKTPQSPRIQSANPPHFAMLGKPHRSLESSPKNLANPNPSRAISRGNLRRANPWQDASRESVRPRIHTSNFLHPPNPPRQPRIQRELCAANPPAKILANAIVANRTPSRISPTPQFCPPHSAAIPATRANPLFANPATPSPRLAFCKTHAEIPTRPVSLFRVVSLKNLRQNPSRKIPAKPPNIDTLRSKQCKFLAPPTPRRSGV